MPEIDLYQFTSLPTMNNRNKKNIQPHCKRNLITLYNVHACWIYEYGDTSYSNAYSNATSNSAKLSNGLEKRQTVNTNCQKDYLFVSKNASCVQQRKTFYQILNRN